jgi:hypothetical protein
MQMVSITPAATEVVLSIVGLVLTFTQSIDSSLSQIRQDSVAFASVEFPGPYLRMDSTNRGKDPDGGYGKVNCQ